MDDYSIESNRADIKMMFPYSFHTVYISTSRCCLSIENEIEQKLVLRCAISDSFSLFFVEYACMCFFELRVYERKKTFFNCICVDKESVEREREEKRLTFCVSKRRNFYTEKEYKP